MGEKMRAYVLHGPNNLTLQQVDRPIPGEGEVLVKIKAAGVCGSDIPRIYTTGAHKHPLIPGHEFSGEIVESRDARYPAGTRTGIFPLIPCKKCGPCLQKKYEMCRNYSYLGSRCDGGFADYVKVPVWNLLPLPKEVSFEQAAMLEPMAVAVHSMRRLHLEEAENILVYGAGTIGTLLVMFLLQLAGKNVLVVGNKDFQRETMLGLGLSPAQFCDSRTTDVEAWVLDRTGDNGADAIYECVGKNEIISSCVRMAAPSGQICFVGNPYSDMELDKQTYWGILRRQLRVTGTWNSSFYGVEDPEAVKDDWHYVIDLLREGKIHPEQLITHRMTMEELVRGFELMRDKSEDYVKVMLVN